MTGSGNLLGIGLGLLASPCWATDILFNRTVGRRLAGIQAPALAAAIAALVYRRC